MKTGIPSSRSNEAGVLKHVDPCRGSTFGWFLTLHQRQIRESGLRAKPCWTIDGTGYLESLGEIQLWGARVCWGPVTHCVTHLHIWQVAVVAPTCKQTLLSSVQGDPLLFQGDTVL